MIISVHVGAHCTHGDTLLHGIWKNRKLLAEDGIVVPPIGRYKDVLPKAMRMVKNAKASDEFEEMVLDQILDTDDCRRVIMSFEDTLCKPPYVFSGDDMYSNVHHKLKWLQNLFPNHQLEFHLGIRNPATFIPELCPSPASYVDLIKQTDLEKIKWSNLIKNIRSRCPNVDLSVFAYEDTPLVWLNVLQTVTGADENMPLSGGLDIMRQIMKRDGVRKLRTYLHVNPPESELQRQEILAAFLEKYVDEHALEEEIDLPGWNNDLIERLSDHYEADLDEIASLSDVEFILPQ